MLQVGVDVTLGTAMVNTGVFVINTILIAALTGRLSPLPDLWSAVKLKVHSWAVLRCISLPAALAWLVRLAKGGWGPEVYFFTSGRVTKLLNMTIS